MEPDRALDRQIRLLRAYAALTYPFACVPFLWFWFDDLGITPPQYATLISVYYVTMVVAEVPTGLLADRFGPRRALICGPLLLALGFVVIGASSTFPAFCAGEALLGLGHSILSGPPAALLFESLRRRGRTGEFHRQEAIANTARLLGTAGAFLVGGALVAAVDIPAAIYLTAGLCAMAAVFAWFLDDLEGSTQRGVDSTGPSLLQRAWTDLRHPAVAWLLVYYVVLFALLRFPFHTYQPFLREVGAEDPLAIGFLFFALNLVAAPCSRLTPWLCRRFGPVRLFWAMPLMISLSLLLMAGRPDGLGIALFFVHQIPFGMHWAVIQDYANHRIGSEARATTLSVLSFAGRIVFSIAFPLAMSLPSLTDAYLWTGAIGSGATVVVLLLGRRITREA
ncbi:MAG: MFS transporter [Planctomycetota bacterium]|nr:MFS transporter [Planctomycetota bacterium]MDA1222330.1 MFS transporter [Planctomycetota bacterium]